MSIIKEFVLAEKEKGNLGFLARHGGLRIVPLDEFVEQPAEGILYDLNRPEEVALTFLDDPKWVNDFAVALVIRKLVEQRDVLRKAMVLCEEYADNEKLEAPYLRSLIQSVIKAVRPYDRQPLAPKKES